MTDTIPHWHCPLGHDKPQPLRKRVWNGTDFKDRVICRACLFENGIATECEPCTPENCDD